MDTQVVIANEGATLVIRLPFPQKNAHKNI